MTTTEIDERAGAAIEARAIERGWKWAPLARRLDIHVSFLNQIRNGQRRPSPQTAWKIEAILGWQHGSIEALYAGGEPTVSESGRDAIDAQLDAIYEQSKRTGQPAEDIIAEMGRRIRRL